MTDAAAPPKAESAPSAGEGEFAGHTPGPWERQERTVYALQPHGFRKGEQQFSNRFSANVQGGRDADGNVTPEAELEAHARLIAAAPALLGKLDEAKRSLEQIAHDNKVREWTATEDNPETHWVIRDGQYARIARAALSAISSAKAK